MFIYIVVQLLSGTFSSCKTKIVPIKQFPITPLFPVPGNHDATFFLYDFDYP
jgi:hypothetical protein